MKVLTFDPAIHGGHKRDEFLLPKDKLLPKILNIYYELPTKLKVSWGIETMSSREDIKNHYKMELG